MQPRTTERSTAWRCAGASVTLVLLWATAVLAEEPVVNVYNWSDYIGPTTLADFEAETGIRVNYDTYDSSEIVEAKLLAGSTGFAYNVDRILERMPDAPLGSGDMIFKADVVYANAIPASSPGPAPPRCRC